ncbi:MAG: fumarylacetoacetate hydrolase family protein [Pelagibacterales bacterium]|nr:fumarylacetoacetate hydrolase family protein [Pelagibacterales bacterium]MBL6874922.1 fumarylacetoacetate hydrolase family protein [Flavobacteriales bacterium]
MKLSTYTLKKSDTELIGLLNKDSLINLNVFFGEISLLELIRLPDWKEQIIKKTKLNNLTTHNLSEVKLLAPIPRPNSLRDAYAFRQHVETSRRNRGLEMIKEFDDFPVFYFSNHNAIFGPSDDIQCMPSHFEKLDYELEIAILIGKEGINVRAENAKEYIAGFMIMNDMSSRGLQMKEMKLNLGPAKGKDFASVLGPYLVTPDEISANIINEDDKGCNYDLQMTCSLNGKLLSKGNLKDMAWSFEKIIERVSYGATIYPGDVIGSGTVGTGCLLEINGTNKLKSSDFTEVWLKENDVVEMEIEKLGKITNKIISNKSNYKIN